MATQVLPPGRAIGEQVAAFCVECGEAKTFRYALVALQPDGTWQTAQQWIFCTPACEAECIARHTPDQIARFRHAGTWMSTGESRNP